MSQKTTSQDTRRSGESAENESKREFEVHFMNYMDKVERWRREHENNVALEEALSSLSRLSYEEVDYNAMLARLPFKEPPPTDFSYLLDKAKKAVEKKFFQPIVIQSGLIILALIILVVSSSVAMWISGTLIATGIVSLVLTFQSRASAMRIAVTKAAFEIEQRQEMELHKIEEAKRQHEQGEDERISYIQRLLEGDYGAVVPRIDAVLSKMKLPFPISVDIDIYAKVLFVKVWLPPKAVIPVQTSTLASNGKIVYHDKEPVQVNKQFLEVCASIIYQILSTIYGNIPLFDKGYACGMTREGLEDRSLINVVVSRQSLKDASRTSTGVAALNMQETEYKIEPSLELVPRDPLWPVEWEDVQAKMLRTLNVKIFK